MPKPTETERVEVLDLDLSGGGGYTSRDASADWAQAARRSARSARRRHGGEFLRLEWPGRVEPWPRGTHWSDPGSPEPPPPPWVDAIDLAEDDESLVRIRLLPGADGPAPVSVELRAPEGGQITAVLRRMGLEWLTANLDRAFVDWSVGRILGAPWRKAVARPGRAGRPDSFYAERAHLYVKAMEEAPDRPVAHLVEMAEREGRERETPAQWRGWLNRARSRGLLTAAPAGRAGGKLTPKGRRALQSPMLKKEQESGERRGDGKRS